MPISLNYNRNENVIYTKAEGVIKLDDIISYFSSVAALNLQESYSVLADHSEAILKLSNKDIQEMSGRRSIDSNIDKSIKIAIFCSEDLVFGIGRMYESLIDNKKYETMIFRSDKEAKEWLNI